MIESIPLDKWIRRGHGEEKEMDEIGCRGLVTSAEKGAKKAEDAYEVKKIRKTFKTRPIWSPSMKAVFLRLIDTTAVRGSKLEEGE